MRACRVFFIFGFLFWLPLARAAQDTEAGYPQPAFRFLFKILRYEKLSSGEGTLRADKEEPDGLEGTRGNNVDSFRLMKPLDWDSGAPRPVSGMGLSTDSVMFGYAEIWSPCLQEICREARATQLHRPASGEGTAGRGLQKTPGPRDMARIEVVPFDDGRVVKTQVTVNDGTDDPEFIWGTRLDRSFAVYHPRAFFFWLENRWPPGSLPVGTFRMVASVRIRVVFGDGTVFLTEVLSMPEEVEIVKARRLYNVTSPDITAVYSWLTLLEIGVDWKHSQDLYGMVLKAFKEGSAAEGYRESGEMDFKLATAAFQQSDYGTAYDAFHRAFLEGVPLVFDPAETLKRIGECADRTGKPDFSKEPAWLHAFRRSFPRY